MTKFTIIRHGQASILSDNYDQLSDIGKQQTQLLGDYFVKNNFVFDQIIQGPLFRHQQTTEGILKAYKTNNIAAPNPVTIEGFREHQGPRVVRAMTPILQETNAKVQELLKMDIRNNQDRIRRHLRIYEYITQRWATGEFDSVVPQYQTWAGFQQTVLEAIQTITTNFPTAKNVAIISSGGPVAVTVGHILGLTPVKTLELSWMAENASISEFRISSKRKSLRYFNNVSHLEGSGLVTVI